MYLGFNRKRMLNGSIKEGSSKQGVVGEYREPAGKGMRKKDEVYKWYN